jgi:membrane protein YqaA with SNARE-associated domain
VILSQIHNLGYVSAFIGGILFVFTFTVALGGIILFNLADTHSVIGIALVGGLGSMVGDLLIFRFINDGLTDELKPLYHRLGGEKITVMFQSIYLRWTLPVIGALIVMSPFPDELGIALMGVSKMKTSHFIVISYVLDVIGLFVLLDGILLFKGWM